jgi:hypothetical protein
MTPDGQALIAGILAELPALAAVGAPAGQFIRNQADAHASAITGHG